MILTTASSTFDIMYFHRMSMLKLLKKELQLTFILWINYIRRFVDYFANRDMYVDIGWRVCVCVCVSKFHCIAVQRGGNMLQRKTKELQSTIYDRLEKRFPLPCLHDHIVLTEYRMCSRAYTETISLMTERIYLRKTSSLPPFLHHKILLLGEA